MNSFIAKAVAGGIAALGVIGIAALLFIGGGKDAPEGGADMRADITGRWEVSYEDSLLGMVRGKAFINKAGNKADVTLYDPIDNKEYQLVSTSFKQSASGIELTLKGDWPGARQTSYPLGEELATNDASQFSVQLGDNRENFSTKPDKEAEQDLVHLRLEYEDGVFNGRWWFRASPQTGREKDGNGRVGVLVLTDDGGAEQSGGESWRRPQPQIAVSVPLEEQMDTTVYEHPDGPGRNYRLLFVVGKELPNPEKENITLTSGDPAITYVVRTMGPEEEETGLERLRLHMNDVAFQAMKRRYDAKELSSLLIEAKLEKSVLPGMSYFAVNGADGAWVLKFADYTGELSFVRHMADPDDDGYELPEEAQKHVIHNVVTGESREGELVDVEPAKQITLYEPAWVAYVPEELRLQIVTTRELPYAAIPMIVAVNGKRALFDGEEWVLAYKDPENAKRYLSDPLAVVDPANRRGAVFSDDTLFADVPLKPGQSLSARVDHDHPMFGKSKWQFAETTPTANAKLLAEPSERGLSDTPLLLTWPLAVKEAASCYRGIEVNDPMKDAVKVVDTYTRYIVNAWATSGTTFRRKTNILLGDHAAMLLLRDSFIDIMSNHIREMQKAAAENPLGLYRSFLPYGYGGALDSKRKPPFLNVKVNTPDGRNVTFYEALGPDTYLLSTFKVGVEELRDWQKTVTQSATSAYLDQLQSVLYDASVTKDCAVQPLLELTGKGFEAIAAQTFPNLVYRSPHDGLWKPDYAARAWVTGQHILAESIKLEAQLASQDTKMLLAEGAALFAIPSMLHGSIAFGAAKLGMVAPEIFVTTSLSSAMLAAFDIAEFGYVAYTAHSTLGAHQRELDFAQKSAAVLGYGRFDAAEEETYGLYKEQLIDVMFATFGLMAGADDIAKTVRLVKQPAAIVEGASKAAMRMTDVYKNPKVFFADQFRPWPGFTLDGAVQSGREIFRRLVSNLSDAARPAADALVSIPPGGVEAIIDDTIKTLTDHRRLFDMEKANPGALRQMREEGKLSAKQYRNISQRISEGGERLFPDPATLNRAQLQQMAERIASDVYAEGARYGLSDSVIKSRGSKRLASRLTNELLADDLMPRLLSGAEADKVSARTTVALHELYDRILSLGAADRELLAMAMRRAIEEGAAGAENVMLAEMRLMYNTAQFIGEQAGKKPNWAKELTNSEYIRVKDMVRRGDLRALMHENVNYVRTVINNPRHLEVLRGQAFEDIAQLAKAIADEEKRIKSAIPGVWDAASPTHGHPKGFQMKTTRRGDSTVTLTLMRGQEKVAAFERKMASISDLKADFDYRLRGENRWLDDLPANGQVLVMKQANIHPVNHSFNHSSLGKITKSELINMLTGTKTAMVEGKGTPVSVYMNLRSMHELGIKAGDPSLVLCQLDGVLNKKVSFQIDWLKNVYPDIPIEDLLKHTHAYQYAETALTQAGYRIKKAHLGEPFNDYQVASKPFGDYTAFGKNGIVEHHRWLDRHGYGMHMHQAIDTGHNIFLVLEPL